MSMNSGRHRFFVLLFAASGDFACGRASRMARVPNMKRIVTSLSQLGLVGATGAAFFALTPWLGCRPLAELPIDHSAAVPPSAMCFTDNHGQIAFHAHGLIAQEPLRFSVHVLAIVVPFALLVWSIWRTRTLGPLSRRVE
jgi:hypothetical protein